MSGHENCKKKEERSHVNRPTRRAWSDHLQPSRLSAPFYSILRRRASFASRQADKLEF